MTSPSAPPADCPDTTSTRPGDDSSVQDPRAVLDGVPTAADASVPATPPSAGHAATTWLTAHLGVPGHEGPRWRIASASGGLFMGLLRATSAAVNVASAGWFYPLLKHLELGQWAARMCIDGRRVGYHGSVAAIYAVWGRVWLLSVCTLGFYWWWRGRHAVQRYLDSQLAWGGTAPRDGAVDAIGKALSGKSVASASWRIVSADLTLFARVVDTMLRLLNAVTLGLAYPLTRSLQLRRWARRIRIDGHRVRYTGTVRAIGAVWLRVWGMSLITLGLYWHYKGKGAIYGYFDRHIDWREPPDGLPEPTDTAHISGPGASLGVRLKLIGMALLFVAAWSVVLTRAFGE